MTKFEKFLWCVLYAFLMVLAGIAAFDAKPIALLIFLPVVTVTNWIFYVTIENLNRELKLSKKHKNKKEDP